MNLLRHIGFPGSSADKEFTCNAGELSLVSGLGRSHGEGIGYPLQIFLVFPVSQMVKNLPTNVRDLSSIPGLGRSSGGERGNTLQ